MRAVAGNAIERMPGATSVLAVPLLVLALLAGLSAELTFLVSIGPYAFLDTLRSRLATYLSDKGQRLEASGDHDAAATLYTQVRDEHPGTHQAAKAAAALERLGR